MRFQFALIHVGSKKTQKVMLRKPNLSPGLGLKQEIYSGNWFTSRCQDEFEGLGKYFDFGYK